MTCEFAEAGTQCHRGDIDLGGCLFGSECPGGNASCPAPTQKEDGSPCNFGSNVCVDGICAGMSSNSGTCVVISIT